MPYELVHPEGEEAPKAMGIADMEKYAAEREAAKQEAGDLSVNGTAAKPFAYAARTAEIGDAGYSDTFRALKAKMDFTEQQYRDQLATLPVRKMKLRKELIKGWVSVLLFLIVIPLGFVIITDILMNVGTKSGLVGIIYLFFKVAMFPAIFISVFFLFPPAVRTLINVQRRYNAFNQPDRHAGYRDKFDLVSFAEEEHFLRQRLEEFDQFARRTRAENLDQAGGGEDVINQDEMTPKQRETLEEMQRMSFFRDYQARISAGRVEGDSKYVILGFGIGIVIALLGFMVMN